MELVFFLQHNWYWVLTGIAVLILLIKFLPRYRIASPDTALIISGLFRHSRKVRNSDGTVSARKFGYRIVRGGAAFYVPATEKIDKLDLSLMQVDIQTAQPVPTKEFISVQVDAVANIKIGSDDLSVATAAEQLLHYNTDQIKELAKNVLEGNMRKIIGQMSISELVQSRDKLAQESIKAAMTEMSNMGLEVISMTIRNFSDKDGDIINTMAQKNVSEKEKETELAQIEAQRATKLADLAAEAEKARNERDVEIQKAVYKQEIEKAQANADKAKDIEIERIRKNLETEKAAAELTKLQKKAELERQQIEIERERLNVEIREKAQAEKEKAIVQAEAEKYRIQAEAEAKLYTVQMEAEAIRMRGEAEAEVMRKKAEAMKLYGEAAMVEMIADKLPEIARAISEPLSKTDKIIMVGEGGATSLAKDTTGTMLQTFEAVKKSVGLDIPAIIRNFSENGFAGRAGELSNSTSRHMTGIPLDNEMHCTA